MTKAPSEPDFVPDWKLTVNAKIHRPVPADAIAGELASHFGLTAREETLYADFPLVIRPGEVTAVVGPSGAGKTVLLRQAARDWPDVITLEVDRLARSSRLAIHCLPGGQLAQRLEVLSRCGLAEPAVLLTAAGNLSGGQRYRLALALAVWKAQRRGRPTLVLADELASGLDRATAWMLARQIRRLADRRGLAFLLATPHDWLLPALRPDTVVVKPIAEPARRVVGHYNRPLATEADSPPDGLWNACIPAPADTIPDPATWPIRVGKLADYRALAWCHYLAGSPAALLRIWAIDAPPELRGWGAPAVAAVCVVSPPVPHVRGRNAAFGSRYTAGPKARWLARLNAEVECISRVVVHPVYRSAGLAVRLVRHAIATAHRPMVEALAAMGAVHPLFERADMTPVLLPPSAEAARLLSAAEVVGLSPMDIVAVTPLREWLASADAASVSFFRREFDRFAARSIGTRELVRRRVRSARPDVFAAVCRKAAAGYVYYHCDCGL